MNCSYCQRGFGDCFDSRSGDPGRLLGIFDALRIYEDVADPVFRRVRRNMVLCAMIELLEHLPENLLLSNPMRHDEAWMKHTVSHKIVDGRMHVTVNRRARREHATQLPADYFQFLRDWNRRASSRACRTLTVRKSR